MDIQKQQLKKLLQIRAIINCNFSFNNMSLAVNAHKVGESKLNNTDTDVRRGRIHKGK
ncbi:hypothetical protein VCHA43P277_160102 [Vibrio chagasii]|nr:hypothetical protein VCHA34P126_140073 [Vibrio chagasii]CAH6987106.1 hypothetical protein VCHA43P277_160102 [Vibrio chagasii]CAH7035191.1 hypothetical protein VCHA41O247_160103 [Vibrio chagasii]CAH7243701.1 hypothetical protein VCHA50P420_160056 [Vibrio chagasii]